MKLRVATCQFPVSADVGRNLGYVRRQVRRASDAGAHVVHFPECALSGYAGTDFASHHGFDWEALREAGEQVLALAREQRLWVLLGSAHALGPGRKPHNSVYVIDPRGRIVERYDKRFCAGDRRGQTGDLSHYTPGDHACCFSIRGVRCGVLICHDYRYPELVRDYKRRGAQLLFHSFHAGRMGPAHLRALERAIGRGNIPKSGGRSYPEITMPASMVAAAASSHVWISCPNTSARHSCFPAFFVRADGVTTGRLQRHRPGVLISEVDPQAPLYDSTRVWRERALGGRLHSGRPGRSARTRDRTRL